MKTLYHRLNLGTHLLLFICIIVPYLSLAQGKLYSRDHRRDTYHKPEMIMDTIGVREGMIIGEIGAGDGYLTTRLLRRVGPTGIVYANDIRESFVDDLNNLRKLKNVENLRTIIGKTDHPLFPDSTMDLVVMIYVFHDLTKPVELMRNIKSSLKRGATVCIIDRDPDRFAENENDYHHFMTRESIINKVAAAGYTVEKVYDFLPRDNIYICKPAQNQGN